MKRIAADSLRRLLRSHTTILCCWLGSSTLLVALMATAVPHP